ncbi:unnamed protein product, partial [Didymodactylos carnosus]
MSDQDARRSFEDEYNKVVQTIHNRCNPQERLVQASKVVYGYYDIYEKDDLFAYKVLLGKLDFTEQLSNYQKTPATTNIKGVLSNVIKKIIDHFINSPDKHSMVEIHPFNNNLRSNAAPMIVEVALAFRCHMRNEISNDPAKAISQEKIYHELFRLSMEEIQATIRTIDIALIGIIKTLVKTTDLVVTAATKYKDFAITVTEKLEVSLMDSVREKVATMIGNVVDSKYGENIKGLNNNDTWIVGEELRKNRQWLKLDLGVNGITDDGVQILCEYLNKNTSLREIFLYDNQMSDQAAEAIANLLRYNKTLATLSLGGNRITDEGVRHLFDVLSGLNITLKELILY